MVTGTKNHFGSTIRVDVLRGKNMLHCTDVKLITMACAGKERRYGPQIGPQSGHMMGAR